jgi:hypothetical protein
MAEQGVQVIFLEPQGHSRRLLEMAGGKNASYSRLSYATTTLNILDVVYENPTDQFDHVITLLGLLLDPLGDNPRRFRNAEVAAIRRALQRTYARYDWEGELMADPLLTPTLETFCHKLVQVAEESAPTAQLLISGAEGNGMTAPVTGRQITAAAAALAEEIESLYVYGDYAGTFNMPTNLDLRLQKQIVLFDFSRVPERRRALFYYATLAAINHQVRRNPRRRAIFVDEVHYMNQEASLMSFLAHMVKTVRAYGAAVVMIDQDLEAFIGVSGAAGESMNAGINVAAGQFIINNVTWLGSMGLTAEKSADLAEQRDEIMPAHVLFLTRMGSDDRHGKGMAIFCFNGRADKVFLQLRPLEAQFLLGS